MSYTVQGGKLKRKRHGEIPRDLIFPMCLVIDDDFYAVITAKADTKDAEPIIAIAGPFTAMEEAKAHNSKWLGLACRCGELVLVNLGTVPAEVRQTITANVIRGWGQGDFQRLRSWQGGDDLLIDLAPKN
jgi:hypothetical protein